MSDDIEFTEVWDDAAFDEAWEAGESVHVNGAVIMPTRPIRLRSGSIIVNSTIDLSSWTSWTPSPGTAVSVFDHDTRGPELSSYVGYCTFTGMPVGPTFDVDGGSA